MIEPSSSTSMGDIGLQPGYFLLWRCNKPGKNPRAKYLAELLHHRAGCAWRCQSQPEILSDVYMDRSTWVPRKHPLPCTAALLCLIRCDGERRLVREICALEARGFCAVELDFYFFSHHCRLRPCGFQGYELIPHGECPYDLIITDQS